MKKIRYNKIFGWLAAAVLLLTTSCKDDMLFGNNNASDEVTVTFTLTPEAAAPLATRGHYGGEDQNGHVYYPDLNEYRHISDGSRADMLIYSIYEKVEDGKGGHKYEILEGYSDGSDFDDIDVGDGQTIKKIKEFPVTLQLTLKRGTEYSIAFWAQNSECKAYNTKDLRKVEVIYSELDESNDAESNEDSDAETTTPNNDERRDAFCRSLTFLAGEGGLEQNVLLYRPLAQINVGTSGYDFETITRNAGKKYLFSKIRLNRVARYLDVVEDKTYSSTTDEEDAFSQDDTKKTAEAFAVADFGYAPIPAYVNWPEKKGGLYPDYPSYTIWDWKYDEDYNEKFPHIKDGVYEFSYNGEEFLKVHLFDDAKEGIITDVKEGIDKDKKENKYTSKGEDGYRQYANLNNYNDYRSETFKYLSMCYVLTSSTKEEAITINNVKVWMATDAQGSDEIEIVNLNNVPAQRNWRTNIVGNILTEENKFEVKLDRDFAGEYSAWNEDKDNWSGPLAKGVYYDAKADEIQISDVDGLIWLQKMVNGDLRVREKKNGTNIVTTNYTEKYPYYVYSADGSKTTDYLNYDGISEPENKTLRDRILKATHQEGNENMKGKTWPEHKNFHFCGPNGPAKIKLMADIDLTGIKWIPIGYDFKIYDTSVNDASKYYDFKESDGTQRAFCGRFDGNNHTISNLTSRRFSAWVHETAEQATSSGPYDNVQWMPSGLFGLVGGCGTKATDTQKISAKQYTEISNLRMFNVEVFGYHTAAAIAAIVNSVNDKIDITNCIVDGGSIELSPMYRGDTHKEKNGTPQTRTFARGIYLGGIVGQYVADGVITGCEVRNVTLHGYRQIGGLVGSVSNQEQDKIKEHASGKFTHLQIKENKIDKLLIIADKFQPYDSIFNIVTDGVWKNGFGWKESQKSLANPFVGGTEKEVYTNNSAGNIQFTEFSTGAEKGTTSRKATIDNVPLKHIPMLSSWFCDEVYLNGNYYGETSGHVDRTYHNFQAYSWTSKDETYSVPFNLPYELKLDYNEKSANAAMYVESVTLDGKNGIGGRSVITPERVTADDACVMYVAARNREQFFDMFNTRKGAGTKPGDKAYQKPTIIKNVVLRGSPYAGVGILFAPNKNMSNVELYNVAIYDVYKTLALHTSAADWKEADNITLTANKCNFRGYTVPGAGWAKIIYTHTTFEEGTYTGHGRDERTYKAEAETEFTDCFFKAPYRIDLSKMPAGKTVTFTNSKAASASPTNKEIKLEGEKANAKLITITSDAMGNPVINYYDKVDEDGKGVGDPFLTE